MHSITTTASGLISFLSPCCLKCINVRQSSESIWLQLDEIHHSFHREGITPLQQWDLATYSKWSIDQLPHYHCRTS